MTKPKCSDCGSTYSQRRRELGYSLCLECGEQAANQASERLRRQCAPAYNKGAYQLITDMQMVRDIGR